MNFCAMRRLALLPIGLLAVLILLASCKHVDETNLSATATDYFLSNSPKTIFYYRSKRSRDETPLSEVKPWTGKPPRRVLVLGEREVNSANYGLVEVEYRVTRSDGECSEIDTSTWVLEDGHWRRISLLKSKEKASRLFDDGNYQGALAAIAVWIDGDPFSVDAYDLRLIAEGRSHQRNQLRTTDDSLRTLLAIDASNSSVLFSAVTHTDDPDTARTFLDRMRPDDCAREVAVFNLVNKLRANSRAIDALKLLDHERSSDKLLLVRISVLRDLKRMDKLADALTAKNDEEIKRSLDGSDGSHAVYWAVEIGNAYLALRDFENARRWKGYALSRDPNDPAIRPLASAIEYSEKHPPKSRGPAR